MDIQGSLDVFNKVLVALKLQQLWLFESSESRELVIYSSVYS